MNLIISMFLGGLVNIAGTVVGKVLLSIGIGYLTFTGVDVALDQVKQLAFDNLASASGMVPQIDRFIGVFQIGTCFNIIFSAYTARFALAGITGGTIKQWVLK